MADERLKMDGIMFSAGLFLADNEIDWQGAW